jgi:L-erythro-3,5-diaminohexanoate dehydrogenase
VLKPEGVLPQAAWQLDPTGPLRENEVAIDVERLNLDAASFRQLSEQHHGDGAAVRDEVRRIVAERGKMHNPVTGSGGMLLGTVAEVGPSSPLGLSVGDRVATLVSLTCTPLILDDVSWPGTGEQVPCRGRAVLFARSIAAKLPPDLPDRLALAVLDVCGAPALTARVVGAVARPEPVVCVIGAGGKSGSLSLAAAREAGAGLVIGVVPTEAERDALAAASAVAASPSPECDLASGSGADSGAEAGTTSHSREAGPGPGPGPGLVDVIVVADARDPVALGAAVEAAGGPADVTVVCVDVPGCEHGAVLATRDRGTVVFFSMATSFPAAALGAEAVAADVTMLVGNGYSAGHAELALGLLRRSPGVRSLFEARLD